MTKMLNSTNGKKYDPRLNTLAQLCVNKIDDLLDSLGVNLYVSGNKYVGCCPIHGDSDNNSTLNIYYDGYDVPGYWKCRSRSCESKFGRTIIGFTRGRLSAIKKGYHWINNPKAIFGFPDTINYLCNFLNIKLNSIKIDPKEEDRRRFISECNQEEKIYKYQETNIHRSRIQKSLIIPAKYFIDRGYPEDILNKYDVGTPKVYKPETIGRVVVPLYNEKEYLIGYTCRSIFEKCEKCRLFHDPLKSCPTLEKEKDLCSKWRHVGFESQGQLYNYWKAKQIIKNTNTAILVEGPGDVWRLEQHDVHNAVGMFGHTLSDGQERKLAKAQCMAMIVLTDNDSAGVEGAMEIKRKYGRLYRMYFPNINEHDAGDMNEDAITDNIKPLIEASMRIYK